MTFCYFPATRARRAVCFARLSRWLVLCLCLVGFFPTQASAQIPDDVHIVPRAKSQRPGSPVPLRVKVDLVTVPVTVTDQKNHPVLDLNKDDFRLFEDQNEQKIQYFFSEDAPLSVGVIVDLSSSMGNKIDSVRQAVSEFFNNANPEDDYFVITFADKPKLLADTTQSIETIQAKLGAAKAKGNTALADAIFMGVRKLHNAKYERKALLIISDGGDNNSRHSLGQVKRMARESDATIYAIDVCDAPTLLITKKLEERFGKQWLTDVTESTGGRTLAVDQAIKIPEAAARASLELRNQYVLGYRPPPATKQNKWRKIKVRVAVAEQSLALQVHYRTGYVPQD